MRRGVPGDPFTGRPHIAIASTASDLAPCNAHLTEVATSVKNGVYEAGGHPLELPAVLLGEALLRPTAMLRRNMAPRWPPRRCFGPTRSTALCCSAGATNHPVLTDGRRLGRSAPGGGARRADADRHFPRRLSGLRHRRLAAAGGGPGRHPLRRAVHPLGVGHDPQPGALQHHGTASTMALVAEALGTVVPVVAGTPTADSRLLEAAKEPDGSRRAAGSRAI